MSSKDKLVEVGCQLRLSGLDRSYRVTSFDGTTGHFSAPPTDTLPETETVDAELSLSDSSKLLWAGPVQLRRNSEQLEFSLCIKPIIPTATGEVISWSAVPPPLSVFDGGYQALSQEEATQLLEDLITFHSLARVRAHFESPEGTQSVDARFSDQESLKELSEVLVEWNHKTPLPTPGQVIVLEIELFEIAHFLIATTAEADHEGLIVALSAHFYRQAQRVGRRLPINKTKLNDHELIEVSDFGMKLRWLGGPPPEMGAQIYLHGSPLEQVPFRVVYVRPNDKGHFVGLFVAADAAEIRKTWQGFILQFQYPLLAARTDSDHAGVWDLLDKTGYLTGTVGEMVKASRESVMREWAVVDSAGPFQGTSVIGKHEGKPIATIGISRASGDCWVAQAAAVYDDPKYLAYTRSMYGWRTRAILQQEDGKYHLAFFAANKPFLDRFFRKFYLTLAEVDRPLVSWEEWRPSFLKKGIVPQKVPPATETKGAPTALQTYRVFSRLKPCAIAGLHLFQADPGLLVQGRPHQHLAQFLASAWIPKGASPNLAELSAFYAEAGHPFVVLMTEQRGLGDIYPDMLASGQLVEGEDEVVWTCERSLLPKFLANSLKALELMVRKYGARQAA